MLTDGRDIPKNTRIDTEVCIIGAGAAGITLAREFIGQPFRVCLLESGGLEYENDTQTLHQGENVGIPNGWELERARLRYFGGTTNHWGGWCRPLDAIDFETRDWIPFSGWPFDKPHLDPFYERAHPICQLGPWDYDLENWKSKDSPSLPFKGDRVTTSIFQISPPTRFGHVYRQEIAHAKNISTILHANVVEIETTKTTTLATGLKVACLDGNQFSVSAKIFILSVGGIENPRLLLLSNKVYRNGLGNQNDLVGRFFMDHAHLESGVLLLTAPAISLGLYNQHQSDKTTICGALNLNPETLRREKLANFSAILERKSLSEMSKGVTSLRVLSRSIKGGGYAR